MGHENIGHEATDSHAEAQAGERYLQLLGLGDLADQRMPGRNERWRDFLDICGEHARPMLDRLASLDAEDPRFAPAREVLREQVMNRVAGAPES